MLASLSEWFLCLSAALNVMICVLLHSMSLQKMRNLDPPLLRLSRALFDSSWLGRRRLHIIWVYIFIYPDSFVLYWFTRGMFPETAFTVLFILRGDSLALVGNSSRRTLRNQTIVPLLLDGATVSVPRPSTVLGLGHTWWYNQVSFFTFVFLFTWFFQKVCRQAD